MKYITGIDIGTGSTKAVALDMLYKPIASVQSFYATESPKPGYSEQNPEIIWKAFIKCINELKEKLGSELLTIGLSSAMHSLIMVDDQGNALAPMITWADNRSTAIAEKLKESAAGIEIYKATGTPIHAMSPLCKIIWLNQNEPELFAKTYKFISIKEYIWFKLFGEFKVDYSIASATGLFNIHTLKWDEQALISAGLKPEQLSAAVPTDYHKHELQASAKVIFPNLKTNFVIGASDGCLANLGSEAITNGIAAVTIGTSGALRLASSKPVYNPTAMPFSYILDAQTFICGGPINNGGIALQWLLKNVFGKKVLNDEDYNALFEAIAGIPAGSEGLTFLPYLAGERAPIWDSKACGTFFGLTLQHDQNHLARAVIEGICYALNDVMKAVEEETNPIKQINVSGGFVHSKVWMQILADITGKKLKLVLQEDASAVGAAYLAAKATGLSEEYPSSAPINPKIIMPDKLNHLKYQRNFLIFKQLYANLNLTMHQLHHLNQ
ncbi:gluconokinase [Pedobacter mendelii]|uniref:Gluconate kinase n=1 Tax=Pedobacter mendelii TaxID=1908240 RepID=A0ABQ2BIT4_9SPHI|nr:gluconokinase [Pedobacter mendelii]GGI27217.1 gluconate kinase [Pedobacter mendelii]